MNRLSFFLQEWNKWQKNVDMKYGKLWCNSSWKCERNSVTLGRKTCVVNGRKVTVFHNEGSFYCMDFHCYHCGGPVDGGDIEDINGVACIVCPWHKYKISLQTGEGYYQAIDPKNLKKPPCWKSKGVKQRTHQVYIENSNVFVNVFKDDRKLDSDYYYSDRYREVMNNMKR